MSLKKNNEYWIMNHEPFLAKIKDRSQRTNTMQGLNDLYYYLISFLSISYILAWKEFGYIVIRPGFCWFSSKNKTLHLIIFGHWVNEGKS